MSEQPNIEFLPEEPQETKEQWKNEKHSLIESLSAQLGFSESSELKGIRAGIINEHGQISRGLLSMWRDRAEVMVNTIEDKDLFKKAQIGLLITRALVYLDADMSDEFYEDVDDAIVYASNIGLEDVVEKLKTL